ncbi:hypothetical protein MATL_G00025380 [Megalops atlanticus]|uniref:MACPF domain-containing protein n=1 Tax=Megalops atlanticus TaxID=7932 RepID=A0A9D3TFR8_MEGAT|nr:hypothetical protein MATL_G00025380 [Megalops atlanticus]
MSCRCIAFRLACLMFLWEWITLSLNCWVLATASSSSDAAGSFGWLLSDKGPFHRSQEFSEFVERYQQGFTTKYKIYREFGRWKVNSLVLERQDNNGLALPLDPEFMQNIRLLGRRPTLSMITENIIKKYGTHFLLSATLGGEESLTIFVDKRKLSRRVDVGDSNSTGVTLETLHQLAASYFIDRESTLRKLHHLQIASTAIKVTETRTGPLGCSNYDNLDSVSSVLVQSPENKIYLQGLQVILPDYLKSRFTEAALSYIGCNSEGEFVCKDNDCWCQCSAKFPRCNCPEVDVHAMEDNLLHIREAWTQANKEFEESDEFQIFVRRLPTFYALNTSAIQYFWKMDPGVHQRYRQLEISTGLLLSKARRIVNKLFTLSKRCQTQPKIVMPRERSFSYWLNYILSIMYCSENNHIGTYMEEMRSCSCPYEYPTCQGVIPCTVVKETAGMRLLIPRTTILALRQTCKTWR